MQTGVYYSRFPVFPTKRLGSADACVAGDLHTAEGRRRRSQWFAPRHANRGRSTRKREQNARARLTQVDAS